MALVSVSDPRTDPLSDWIFIGEEAPGQRSVDDDDGSCFQIVSRREVPSAKDWNAQGAKEPGLNPGVGCTGPVGLRYRSSLDVESGIHFVPIKRERVERAGGADARQLIEARYDLTKQVNHAGRRVS